MNLNIPLVKDRTLVKEKQSPNNTFCFKSVHLTIWDSNKKALNIIKYL